ncbi:Zn-ribbon domain-containing OB-fold protein [Mumia sp. DW29H23]|uniref:Zn-ribbon domain-containing OB-fold protein n=1 Tax=Mumia sp. DW29H23 TaxID=3421241 RepID=UPI003D69BD0A
MPSDLPPLTAYDQLLTDGVLAFQRCAACGAAVFTPRTICPTCGSTELAWEPSAGLGTVYSATTLHPRGRDPYAVVLVDLDEGFRMLSRITVLPSDGALIGRRVRASLVEGDEGEIPLPCFAVEEA